jgi:pimeloyl-ACP methyl ester carboxylesterase
MKMNFVWLLFFLCCSLFFSTACRRVSPLPISNWQGSGVAVYTDYVPFSSKEMRVFYHVPSSVNAKTPIVFVMHGAERNAMDYRNAISNLAAKHNFIAVVPEFLEENFPDVNAYQLGNIYQNGDAPSIATLNAEENWTLSIIEPLFSYVRNQTKNTTSNYHMIGHSAGAQFAHRFLFFKPQNRLNRLVVSAAGWYTMPDLQVVFPYGLQNSYFENIDLAPAFATKVFVQVGAADNNPNASSLRRNALADAQGTHRLSRAQYFYNVASTKASLLSLPFQWELHIIPGLNHNFQNALGYSVNLLFP